MNMIKNTEVYKSWLKELKEKVYKTQLKAAVLVNKTLLEFYWDLGKEIVKKQKNAKWGSGFLKQLSLDLSKEFPEVKGFSKRNLEQIRRWYLFYDIENSVTKQLASQLFKIPWWHNIVIITKCKQVDKALFYVEKSIENGWSRSVLTHQIENGLYERTGKAITNFSKNLPKVKSDLAKQIIKDPYNFDFLTLTEDYNEHELEKELLNHITKFLLELGSGFSFVGRQKQLKVGNRDFYIDLLFYHTKLHCYIVIELKICEFEPEFIGKLNFYIKAVDKQIKTDRDDSTIGILLCKSHDKVVVEYSLSDVNKPIGVSKYQLIQSLPENLKSSLPTIEEIEAEINKSDKH